MRRAGAPAAVALVLALLAGTAPAGGPVRTLPLDPDASHIGFSIRPRVGPPITGAIARFHGRVELLDDGREQITVVLEMDSASLPGHPHLTRWMRGRDFFDVERHPQAVFRSLPHPPGLGRTGGQVEGRLLLRGIEAPVRLEVLPAGCDRAGYDCPVTGTGGVSRSRHGMDRWQLAVGDEVTLVLTVRLQGAEEA